MPLAGEADVLPCALVCALIAPTDRDVSVHPSTGMPNEQSGVMFAGPVATTDWVADGHRLARD